VLRDVDAALAIIQRAFDEPMKKPRERTRPSAFSGTGPA